MTDAPQERQRLWAETRTYYERSLAAHGDSPQGVNWSSAESQALRFAVLAGIGDLNGCRVHDVGCGLGHFADYLEDAGITCSYVGSDISPVMVQAAAERPRGADRRFEAGNILLGGEPWMAADYLINSGIFTVRGATDEAKWRAFVFDMAARMFDLAEIGIAFNLMTSCVDYRDDHLFYCPPSEMLDFCLANLSRHVVIRHDYPLYEFTTYVYKSGKRKARQHHDR